MYIGNFIIPTDEAQPPTSYHICHQLGRWMDIWRISAVPRRSRKRGTFGIWTAKCQFIVYTMYTAVYRYVLFSIYIYTHIIVYIYIYILFLL